MSYILNNKETEEQAKLFNKLQLNFILENNCYCVPMNIKDKKPLSRYAWKQQTQEEYFKELEQISQTPDKRERAYQQTKLVHQYRSRKHTQNLNRFLVNYHQADIEHKETVFRYLGLYDYAQSISSFAIVAGKSNLLVIDCDTSNHNEGEEQASCIGLDNLKKWCKDYKVDFNLFLLNALIVRTTSGGYHFIFKYKGSYIKKEIGLVNSVDLITGQNVFNAPYCARFTAKGAIKRYLPVKLSEQEGSFVYEYLPLDTQLHINILPVEIESALIRHQEAKRKPYSNSTYKPILFATSDTQVKRARSILERHLNNFALVSKGKRNNTLLKDVAAVFMFYHYLKSVFTIDDIKSMFEREALNLGMVRSEFNSTFNQAVRFGLDHAKELN